MYASWETANQNKLFLSYKTTTTKSYFLKLPEVPIKLFCCSLLVTENQRVAGDRLNEMRSPIIQNTANIEKLQADVGEQGRQLETVESTVNSKW